MISTTPGERKGRGMAWVRPDKAPPGARLTEDVRDRSGRVLARSGAELNPQLIAVLQSWGVASIPIDSPGAEAPAAPLPQTLLEAARTKTERRFADYDPGHPAVAELIDVCTERLARRSARGHEGAQ